LRFKNVFHSKISQQVALKPGGFLRGIWTDVPFPLDFRINIFNLTNPDEFLNGGKPRVHEIGPYMFE
jgi:scavenger receptor class B, member 1